MLLLKKKGETLSYVASCLFVFFPNSTILVSLIYCYSTYLN